ncbi:MAG: glucose-6-phosphate isomerase, partial [Bacillota bacterium]|nr:glucose-6-phosphate isomerase [Bacillota bacterium]
MKINVSLKNTDITEAALNEKRQDAGLVLDKLWSGKLDYTGWVQAPIKQDKSELDYILNVADIVKTEAQLMVVIGVGGSYMSAKAAIEALPKTEDGIDVRFAGINFSSPYHRELMDEMSRKETVLCVVSKSGNTMEIRAAFDILKDLMEKKYGSKEAAARRIITITDKERGALREETEKADYVSFEIPEDIGGRYSALTPAGLFPMAVAGIDIRALIEGEKDASMSPEWDNRATDYAIARYLMMEQGKQIETIEFYDPRLTFLGEWMKQLYGESEGKEGKGLFPVTLNFSTDLHSMGQFLQQGNQIFFETVILVDEYEEEIEIPTGPLAGKTLEDINRAAVAGVTEAHRQAG